MRILITRPQPSAAALARALGEEGAAALCVPAIEIVPSAQLSVDESFCEGGEVAIFTSVPAVESFFARLRLARFGGGKVPPTVFAVGPATAAALRERGVLEVLLPPQGRFDSEGLLAARPLAAGHIRGRRVWIVKGEGGRRLLGDTLRRRGAIVSELDLYLRRAPAGLASDLEDLARIEASAPIDAIILASFATFEHLIGAASWVEGWLSRRHLVAAGERVATAIGSRLGIEVVAAADASHASFVEALVETFDKSLDRSRSPAAKDGLGRKDGGGR